MSVAGVALWRRLTGWLGSLLFTLTALAVVDGLVSQARRQANTLDTVPGEEVVVSGYMPPETKDVQDLAVETDGAPLEVTLASTYRGFWLGAAMWRAQVRVAPQAPAGSYTLRIAARQPQPQARPHETTIRVYPDHQAWRQASPSLLVRHMDVAPFVAAVGLFPLALLTMGANFLLTRRLEQHMAREGKAEVYMVKKSSENCLISFALGQSHGLYMGDELDILNEQGLIVGAARVVQSSARESVAQVESDVGPIDVGFFVSVRR